VILTKSGKLEVTAYLINVYVMKYGVTGTPDFDKRVSPPSKCCCELETVRKHGLLVILTKSGKLEVTAYLINVYVMKYGVTGTQAFDKRAMSPPSKCCCE
jgi:hypothetical protein